MDKAQLQQERIGKLLPEIRQSFSPMMEIFAAAGAPLGEWQREMLLNHVAALVDLAITEPEAWSR